MYVPTCVLTYGYDVSLCTLGLLVAMYILYVQYVCMCIHTHICMAVRETLMMQAEIIADKLQIVWF